MTLQQDLRDRFIIACIAGFSVTMMHYAYRHPDPVTFGAACTGVTTLIGLFHWFTIKDDKTPDA